MCWSSDAVKTVFFPRTCVNKAIKMSNLVRPVVEQTGLGSLCLSERRGVPRMCVGVVMR